MSSLKNKRILITGGGGSIGSELVRQLAPDNKIFIIDNNETNTYLLREEMRGKGYWVHSRTGDVRNKATVFDVFSDFKPQIVFHAAALKHVTPNEEYPREAVETNIIGTLNMIEEAKNWECVDKFVFISTDKVVNANCNMGITKLCAEGLVRKAGFIAVRFGNVLNSRGSVLKIWEKQVKDKIPITITDKRMERYMMTIPDACELVIEASQGKQGELYIMDMGERKKIIDLKEELYPDYPIKEIGMRPGETLDEKLMTKDEEKLAIKRGKFYIL